MFGHWTAILVMFGVGVTMLYQAALTSGLPSTIRWAAGVLLLITALGLFRWASWGVWMAVLAYLGFSGYFVNLLFTEGWRWTWAVFPLLGLHAAREVWKDFQIAAVDGESSGKEKGESMISLVLWLSEPRRLSAHTIAKHLSAAWGVEFQANDSDGSDSPSDAEKETEEPAHPYVVGATPLFLASDQKVLLCIHNRAEPYLDDPEAAAAECRDARLAGLMREHRAWISIDAMQSLDPAVPRESFYPQMARFIAALDHSSCLALFVPQTDRCLPWTDDLRAALLSPDPRQSLQDLYPEPVLQMSDEDPEMKAAVAKARERWPEFVEAFNRREPEQPFAVKFPLHDGENVEFIWMNVSAIEGDTIRGTLGNTPLAGHRYSEGDPVETTVQELNDWMYSEGEKLAGGFTTEVLLRAAKSS